MENAVVGAITEALEPFATFVTEGMELVAVDITSVPVRLSLAARPGTPLAAVMKRAWSHPAALRQCTHRLAQMGIERVVCYDTAGAAQIVAHEASTDAAVCSRRAAERYGLAILVEDVSDKEQNGTRFVHLRMADHARAQVSLAFLRTSSMTATGRLDVLTGATLLPLAGTTEYPVRMWVLGADAARLQALAPVRDVQVILARPARGARGEGDAAQAGDGAGDQVPASRDRAEGAHGGGGRSSPPGRRRARRDRRALFGGER